MNAIEIRSLSKHFGKKQAVNGLNMTVPAGAIYGFIGENGSGKSTTEKMICGLLHPNGGTIRLYGKDYTDAEVRAKIGVLIEAPGCFPNLSVWNNMMIQADNLGIQNPRQEIAKVLKTVRMEGAAGAAGLVMCMLAKIFLMSVFVAIAVLVSAFAKQRSWLSILLFLFGGMLLFMMIPMLTPLNAGVMNVGLCLAGGVIFAAALGCVSRLVLSREDLV